MDRLTADKLVEKAFWMIVAGLGAMTVSIMSDLSKGVADLNIKLAQVVQQVTYNDLNIRDNKQRIDSLERRYYPGPKQ